MSEQPDRAEEPAGSKTAEAPEQVAPVVPVPGAAAQEEKPVETPPAEEAKRKRGRPPGSKNKPKPKPEAPPAVPVPAAVSAPVAPVEPAREVEHETVPEEAPPTPAMTRAMRQVSSDRFEELLTRNTMEF